MSNNMKEKLIFSYIRNIKRWIFCPNCEDKMRVNKKNSRWECMKCDYSLSVREFENDCVFWFCDECNVFLNNQPAFDIKQDRWICAKCGHDNDISKENILDLCKDCGITIEAGAKYGLCDDCRKARHDKWATRLKKGVKVAGVIGIVAGFIYIVAKKSS